MAPLLNFKKSLMKDRYFNTGQVAYQLVRNYWKHNNVIVAFDFDDTIWDYHGMGDDHEAMIDLLTYLSSDKARFKLILFTSREGKELEEAIAYCKSRGIDPGWVNESPVKEPKGRKPFYNIFFDDKAGLGQAYEAFIMFLMIIRDKYAEKNRG